MDPKHCSWTSISFLFLLRLPNLNSGSKLSKFTFFCFSFVKFRTTTLFFFHQPTQVRLDSRIFHGTGKPAPLIHHTKLINFTPYTAIFSQREQLIFHGICFKWFSDLLKLFLWIFLVRYINAKPVNKLSIKVVVYVKSWFINGHINSELN